MPEARNSNPLRTAQSGPSSDRQDTILLADAPASLLTPIEAPPPAAARLDLSSSVLQALGQRYDILGEAGQGSMGNVYKARDRETGEIVALKLLKPEIASDQAMMERFKNELLFARKITHKNVCRVYDFNRVAGIAYTSMEFVEGESLRSVLNRFGGLPARKGVSVALQICSGLKEAHAQGIVHRDLKPENVMVDSNGDVKIMDFGIARSMEAATRLTGSMVGTPAYMAPEQVSGKPVDYRTDIYSLGLVMYEMFTGSQALRADTPVALALKQLRETPLPPHEIEPAIPVPIERAILKCLEKDPAKRFQSAAELEKSLSAPGVTGSSPDLAPFATPVATTGLAPAPASRDGRAPTPPAAASNRHTPALVWILLGASIVFAALSVGHWAKVLKQAKLTPPPPALPAPKPPDFALTIPANQPTPQAPEATDAANASSAKKLEQLPSPPTAASQSARAIVKPSGEDVFPKAEFPVKKSARQLELEKEAPADVQQRADKAFAETKSSSGGAVSAYLWVARYQREDKAQETVHKIRGLGLPVKSIQRHGLQGPFWVVVTGPFAPNRVSDVMQWLESQGYRNVHEFQLPGSGNRQNAKPE